MSSRPGAIVIGGHVNGLTVSRSLAARAVPTTVVATMPYDIAQYSRCVVERLSCPAAQARPEEALLDLLDRQKGIWSGRILFPTTDPSLEIVARHHESLAQHYRLVTPPWSAVRPLIHKELFADLAQRVGVEIPAVYGAVTGSLCEFDDLEFPLLVKPIRSQAFRDHFGVKLFTVERRDQLRCAWRLLEEAGLEAQAVEWIPGPDSEMFDCYVYLDRSGELAAHMQCHRLRNGPPFFGVTRAAETVSMPDLLAPTLSILRAVGFSGIANAQFKRDPRTGRFHLLEINGRSALTTGLAIAAGIDLPWIAYSEAVEGRVAPVTADGRHHSWIHLHADVLYWLLSRKTDRVSLRELWATLRRPLVFGCWSRRDPMPFLHQWARSARLAVGLVGRRALGGLANSRLDHSPPSKGHLRPSASPDQRPTSASGPGPQ